MDNITLAEQLVYDPEEEKLTYKGKELELTWSQQKIMELLAGGKGKIVKRESLMIALWQTDTYISEGSLTTCVSRLRSRFRKEGIPDPIRTKKGIGYYIP